MTTGKYVSKIMPDQIRENVYNFFFTGINCLIFNAKIERFFINLRF